MSRLHTQLKTQVQNKVNVATQTQDKEAAQAQDMIDTQAQDIKLNEIFSFDDDDIDNYEKAYQQCIRDYYYEHNQQSDERNLISINEQQTSFTSLADPQQVRNDMDDERNSNGQQIPFTPLVNVQQVNVMNDELKENNTTTTNENDMLFLHETLQDRSGKTVVKCKECGKIFRSDVKFRLHIKEKHKDKNKLLCWICYRLFPTKRSRISHAKQKEGLANHFRDKHPGERFQKVSTNISKSPIPTEKDVLDILNIADLNN